jgi:anti-sigma factor RsiW
MRIIDSLSPVSLDDHLIDRLVDGELDEADREALLRRLDREPGGWKRCALAFLEAQAWADACAAEGNVGQSPQHCEPRVGTRLRPQRLAAIAAAVMLAFLTGFLARGPGLQSDATGSTHTVARLGSPSDSFSSSAATVAPPVAAASAVPEYLRQQMERQGYEVHGQMKVLPVALDDGRKVALPVEKVSLRYVGQRIH